MNQLGPLEWVMLSAYVGTIAYGWFWMIRNILRGRKKQKNEFPPMVLAQPENFEVGDIVFADGQNVRITARNAYTVTVRSLYWYERIWQWIKRKTRIG